MQILIDIPDNVAYGVSFAREARNAELPETIEQDGAQVANPARLASNADYVAHVVARAVESWCAQANVAPPPPPAPVAIVNGVPQEVTRRQGIQALINTGKLALVQPAIDAIADPMVRATMQNEWDNSQTFQRQRQSLIALATQGLAMTLAELDALFTLAYTL